MRIKIAAALGLLGVLATGLYFIFLKPVNIADLAASIENDLILSQNIQYESCLLPDDKSIFLTGLRVNLPAFDDTIDILFVHISNISGSKGKMNIQLPPDDSNSIFKSITIENVKIKKFYHTLAQGFDIIKPSELGLGFVHAKINPKTTGFDGLLKLNFDGKKAELSLTDLKNTDNNVTLNSFKFAVNDIDSFKTNLQNFFNPLEFSDYLHMNPGRNQSKLFKEYYDAKLSQIKGFKINKIELENLSMLISDLVLNLEKLSISNINELNIDVLVKQFKLMLGDYALELENLQLKQIDPVHVFQYVSFLKSTKYISSYFGGSDETFLKNMTSIALRYMAYAPYNLESIKLGTVTFKHDMDQCKLHNFKFKHKPYIRDEKVSNSSFSFDFEFSTIPQTPDSKNIYAFEDNLSDYKIYRDNDVLYILNKGKITYKKETDQKDYITYSFNVECKNLLTLNLSYTINNIDYPAFSKPQINFENTKDGMLSNFRLELKNQGMHKLNLKQRELLIRELIMGSPEFMNNFINTPSTLVLQSTQPIKFSKAYYTIMANPTELSKMLQLKYTLDGKEINQ